MSRLLDGANPLTTWRMFTKQCADLLAESEQSREIRSAQSEVIKRLREDLKTASSAKLVE